MNIDSMRTECLPSEFVVRSVVASEKKEKKEIPKRQRAGVALRKWHASDDERC